MLFKLIEGMLYVPQTQDAASVQHLSNDELIELVQAITEQHGNGLTLKEFTEKCFDLFEDVSGMEGITTQDAMEIINLLWNIYYDQVSP